MATTQAKKDIAFYAPKLRFKDFNDSWKHVRLSHLLSESKKRNADLKFGKDRVLSVSGRLGVVNQISHLGRSYAGESVHNYHVVEKGQIVYTKSPLKNNPYGIIKLNKGDAGIVSTLYAVYKPITESCYAPFLDHYFSIDANTNRYLRPLVKIGAKNDMKINNEYVLHDKVFAPSVGEQKKISDFIDLINSSIQKLETEIALLKKYKKGIVQKIFSQEVCFKDQNNSEFPKWESKRLDEIGRTFNGLTGKSADDFGAGEPYITYKQIFDRSEINIENFSLVKILPNEKQSRSQFGDVFFTTSSETPEEVGYSSVLLNKEVKPFLNSFCFGFRPKSLELLNPYFAKYLFRSAAFRKDVIKLAQGSTRYNISKTQFMKISVSLPSPEEQQLIANYLGSIDAFMEKKERQIALTASWRYGLMQQLFI